MLAHNEAERTYNWLYWDREDTVDEEDEEDDEEDNYEDKEQNNEEDNEDDEEDQEKDREEDFFWDGVSVICSLMRCRSVSVGKSPLNQKTEDPQKAEGPLRRAGTGTNRSVGSWLVKQQKRRGQK